MLTLDHLALAPRLAPVSLSLARGRSLALLGPTGSGKSTLLRLVAGLDAPGAGSVTIDGRDVTRLAPHKRGVAMLPQRPGLYPEMTVARNLAVIGGVDAKILALLRLESLLARRPDSLSGGELQRVALAKVVASGRPIWLLDEPMGGLDAPFRSQFRHDLHLLAAWADATMVLVTHDPADAWALGHTVGVLDRGHLRQLGSTRELWADPNHLSVAACFGRVGFLTGRVGGGDPTGAKRFASDCGALAIPAPPGARDADNLALGLWPDDIRPTPGSTGATLTGWRITSAEPDGSGWLVSLASPRDPGVRLSARWPAESPPPVGTPTDWAVTLTRGLWFRLPDGHRLRAD